MLSIHSTLTCCIKRKAINSLYSSAVKYTITIILFFGSFNCFAHSKLIEHGGDVLQIVGPLTSLLISADEKGIGHFGAVFGSTIATSLTLKGAGILTKPKIGRRPQRSANKKSRYDGFPSGHTTAVFAAASYVRHYGGKWRMACVPLYTAAAFTGFSRVHSKWHTKTQVAGGILLGEIAMYASTKLDWCNNYQATPLIWSDNNGINARLTIKF